MYINFRCLQCETNFRIDELNLYQLDSIACPSCKKKVPKNFIMQLQDFVIESNSQPFAVTFLSTPKIKIEEISNMLFSYVKEVFRETAPVETQENLITLFKSDEGIQLVSAMVSGAICGYHNQLKDSLGLIGIDIGEIE